MKGETKMRKKQKELKVPELYVRFIPTTKGYRPFNVHETLHTITLDDPVPLLIEQGIYRDSVVDGKCYNLNKRDTRKMLDILIEFIDECIDYTNIQIKRRTKRTVICCGLGVLLIICPLVAGITAALGHSILFGVLMVSEFILTRIFMKTLIEED